MSFIRQIAQPLRASARSYSSAASPAAAGKKTLFQTWYEPAALPIFAVVGIACGGAGWYLSRLMRHQDVIWDRHGNPEPWNNVANGSNSKMFASSRPLPMSSTHEASTSLREEARAV